MRMYDLIYKKRNGGVLDESEIAYIVREYTAGNIPDYQISALLMAIWFRGMNDDETRALTMAMAYSGDTIDLSDFGTLTVDKHSSGGVGDKTTLIVAPLAAACGCKVAKMSGRGLGHTGGTVDKLESIRGYRTTLGREDFLDQVDRVGIAVVGQSEDLTPADKKLYALRDVTATVDSDPLIVSSIMSKKLAAGSRSIVLDVKVGSGAFMKTPEAGRQVAHRMVTIGQMCGRRVTAMITNMDIPLGFAVGNALEVREAIAVLRGEEQGALRELCVALAARMVSLACRLSSEEAEREVLAALDSGRAYEKMKEWIAAQGGDVAQIEHPERLPQSPIEVVIFSKQSGYITGMDAEEIGLAALELGAGRIRKEDEIDHGAGLLLLATIGDYVQARKPIARLYTSDREKVAGAVARFEGALTFGENAPESRPLIYEILSGEEA